MTYKNASQLKQETVEPNTILNHNHRRIKQLPFIIYSNFSTLTHCVKKEGH